MITLMLKREEVEVLMEALSYMAMAAGASQIDLVNDPQACHYRTVLNLLYRSLNYGQVR